MTNLVNVDDVDENYHFKASKRIVAKSSPVEHLVLGRQVPVESCQDFDQNKFFFKTHLSHSPYENAVVKDERLGGICLKKRSEPHHTGPHKY